MLVHGQAFPGDRRLVQRRAAGVDACVQRHPRAGAHPDAAADRHPGHRLGLPGLASLDLGSFRRDGRERLDRVPGTLQRQRLDRLGHGKQEHHHRRFRPLAERHGPGHGDGHQEVDIEGQVSERDPALLEGGQTGAEDGHGGKRHHHPRGFLPARPGDDLGRDGGGASHGEQTFLPSAQGGGKHGHRRIGFQQIGCHAQLVQRHGNLLGLIQAVIHRELPIHEVEVELHNPGHGLQLVADQALLGRAVHLVDAVAHPAGPFGCRIGVAHPREAIGLCRRGAAGIGRRVGMGMRIRAVVVTMIVRMIVVTCGLMVLRLDRQA
ncbi:conserved protein of unknown function (plasmid) [Thiomonas sp. Sup16B3]|nr:conserved protein of unknown function [Thiomonas sp. Sup16B3]